MSETALYRVASAWYEDYSPTIVEGPPVPDWTVFCDSLLDEAVAVAIRRHEPQDASWIGWGDIVWSLLEVLQTRGYRVVEPPEARYWGACIIQDADDQGKLSPASFAALLAHNNGVEREANKGRADD
jgi:hypothetical protein